MEQIKPEKLNAIATIKESFALTLKNIKPVMTAQWLYFVLLSLLVLPSMAIAGAFMTEHSAVLMEATKNKAELPPEVVSALIALGLKLAAIMTLGYVLHKIFMNNMYEWMSSGRDLGPFTIWPISKNTWQLMWLDVKVFFACFIPLLVTTLIVGVLIVSLGLLKSEGGGVGNAILLVVVIVPIVVVATIWLVYRTFVFVAAQPSIYEAKPIPLIKGFWKATKGNRWKILISNLVVMLPAMIMNKFMEHLFKDAFQTGHYHMAYVGEAAMLAASFFVGIWLAFSNVLIWKHIRKNVPELVEPSVG